MVLISAENPLGQMPNPHAINQILTNSYASADVDYNNLLYPGFYYIKLVSGGGNVTYHDTGWNGTRTSGGSGAVWEGRIRVEAITNIRATVSAGSSGVANLYLNGARCLYLTGGTAAFRDAPGGVLTVDSAFNQYIIQAAIASNGNPGVFKEAAFGWAAVPANPSPSTQTTGVTQSNWGAGGGSTGGLGDGGNIPANAGGFFLQRVG